MMCVRAVCRGRVAFNFTLARFCETSVVFFYIRNTLRRQSDGSLKCEWEGARANFSTAVRRKVFYVVQDLYANEWILVGKDERPLRLISLSTYVDELE